MKKSYIFTLALCLLALSAMAAPKQGKRVHLSKEKVAQLKSQLQHKSGLRAAQNAAATTILFEDFSKFTAGSEAAPDATDIANATTGEIPASYTQEGGWYGYGVYQAGGKAYIGMATYEDEDGEFEDTGFMDTPIKDLSANSGTFTVKFKAKSTYEDGDLVLVLWYDDSGYDYEMIEITNAWNDYEIEFLEAGTSATGIEMFSYYDPVFFDDIQIVQDGGNSLPAPHALDATEVSATGFTANWENVESATGYELNVYTKEGINVYTSDLFISEYVEGSSNNKAIEIYNGTGASVDLSNYSLKKQTNGAGEYGSELKLSGTLTNNKVYVIAHSSASTDILAVADLKTTNQAINFNGNDAVALYKGSSKLDEVGVFNQTTNWGADLTLIRKSTVSAPKTTYNASEWDTQAKDYIANLGSHSYDGISETKTPITGSPFSVTTTSREISDLATGIYYYTVVAKNEEGSSASSNEIKVDVGTTGINTPHVVDIYIANKQLVISKNVSSAVEIYHVSGALVAKYPAGTQTISTKTFANGVYLVKAGNKIQKVIF